MVVLVEVALFCMVYWSRLADDEELKEHGEAIFCRLPCDGVGAADKELEFSTKVLSWVAEDSGTLCEGGGDGEEWESWASKLGEIRDAVVCFLPIEAVALPPRFLGPFLMTKRLNILLAPCSAFLLL